MNRPGVRRLHIERIELDLSGVDPAVAEAAVQALGPALGPALARALAAGCLPGAPPRRLDAGSVACPARPAPGALAADIAQTLARRITGGRP